jgi:hypothetical protein
MIEGIGYIVIEGKDHNYEGASFANINSSVEVEFSTLVCNHNHSLCCIYIIY